MYSANPDNSDRDRDPYASTGKVENDGKAVERKFVDDLMKDVQENGVNLRALGLHTVTVVWKGKKRSFDMSPDFTLADSTEDRIESKLMRLAGAAYMVWRDEKNGCMIRSRFCTQGEHPFEHPESADFDHINGNKHDHRLVNLRLACSPCNSHQQGFQRKQILAAASGGDRERESPGSTQSPNWRPYHEGARESVRATSAPSSTETERNIAMRPRWLKWIRSDTWKGEPGPLAEGAAMPLERLCEKAPRALARDDMGEETLGTPKTYLYNYVPMDLDIVGGPLHVWSRVNSESGKTETYVKLAEPQPKQKVSQDVTNPVNRKEGSGP